MLQAHVHQSHDGTDHVTSTCHINSAANICVKRLLQLKQNNAKQIQNKTNCLFWICFSASYMWNKRWNKTKVGVAYLSITNTAVSSTLHHVVINSEHHVYE